MSIIGVELKSDLNLTDLELSWFFSAFLAAYALFQLPGGMLVDRFGARRTMSYSMAGLAVTTVVFAFLASNSVTTSIFLIVVLTVLRGLSGVFQVPVQPIAIKMIASWVKARHSAVANGVVSSAGTVSPLVAAPAIAISLNHLGWEWTLYATAAVPTAFVLVWFVVAQDQPEANAVRQDESEVSHKKASFRRYATNPLRPGISLLRSPQVAILSLSFFCAGFTYNLFMFWFFIYLVEDRGFDVGEAGFAYGALASIAALAAVCGGRLADVTSMRFGFYPAKVVMAVAICSVMALGLFVGANAEAGAVVIVGFMIAMAALAALEPCYWSTIARMGGNQAGTAASAINTFGSLGGVLSTALVPYATSLIGWTGLFSATACVALLQGVLWLPLARRR